MKPSFLSRIGEIPRFLLIFFAPVAGAIALTFAYGFLSVDEFRSIQKAESTREIRLLNSASDVSQLGYELLGLQRMMAEALHKAKTGAIDELSAYRLHGLIVNRLAALDARVRGLDAGSPMPSSIATEIEQFKLRFELYHRYTMQASDIVAVNSSLAEGFIDKANEQYYALAEKLQAIDVQVTGESLRLLDRTEAELEHLAGRTKLFGLLATMVGIIAWFFIALYLSRRLSLLARALSGLAAGGDSASMQADMDAVDRLGQRGGVLIGGMARAVMAFREANAQRNLALGALDAERRGLEDIVAQRTARLLDAGDTLARQQRSLRAINAEQQAVLDTVPVGIALFKARRVERCNAMFEDMFGYPARGMEGLSVRVLCPDGKERRVLLTAIVDDTAGGGTYRREVALTRADGGRFKALLSVRRFGQGDGPGDRMLAVVEDIT